MKYGIIAAALATTLGVIACTTETITQQSAVPETEDDAATPPPSEDAATADGGDAAPPDDGKIGTRSDKGEKSVSVDISSHGSFTCDAVCKAAGGTCKLGKGNGVGYVNRKYNNNSGTLGNQVTSCTQSESYFSGNTTMTSMDCFCSDMTAPPTVRVRKAEGLFACSKVCASWSLTCAEKRGHYGYSDEEELSSTKLDCATPPAATTHHYICSCDI